MRAALLVEHAGDYIILVCSAPCSRFSFARQVDYHQSPATTGGGRRGRRHYSYCTSDARTEAVAFILSAEAPAFEEWTTVRRRASKCRGGSSARAFRAFRTRTSTSAHRRRGGRHAAWIFQFDVDSGTVPRLPRGYPRGAVARVRELSVPTSLSPVYIIHKYSMAIKHFAVEHPGHEPPKEFSEVSGAEKTRLAKPWQKIEAKRPAKPCV